MQCPKCDEGQMVNVHEGDVTIVRCDRCYGLLFDQLNQQMLPAVAGLGELDTGDENLGAAFDEMVYVDCPKCNRIMDQQLLEEPVRIRFEICRACHATFLDAGEFRLYLSDGYANHFLDLLPDTA
ncbi:MAG: zf-TFIIB domain-containing protein [Pseudomonadota bacterium]